MSLGTQVLRGGGVSLGTQVLRGVVPRDPGPKGRGWGSLGTQVLRGGGDGGSSGPRS